LSAVYRSSRRPLLQHTTSLPDRQPRPWSLLDETVKDTLSFSEAVSREQQFFDTLPIPARLLDLVEVAPVGVAGIVGFFGGSGVRYRVAEAPLGFSIAASLRASARSMR
jgi:hypothetical protein